MQEKAFCMKYVFPVRDISFRSIDRASSMKLDNLPFPQWGSWLEKCKTGTAEDDDRDSKSSQRGSESVLLQAPFQEEG